MPRKVVGLAAVAITMLIATLLPSVPAWAVFTPGAPATVKDAATELTLSGIGPGTSVSGFLADPDNPFNPVTEGYPTADPAPGTGWTAQVESFAGVIYGSPTDGSPTLTLYCINIRTDTYIGVGYQLGDWNSANVANVGYVATLLNTYYPATDEPASITNLDQKAAAVQAAIWFFSDSYVLSTSDPLYDAVAAIVDAVIQEGPLPTPSPPSLTITPGTISSPTASIIGPFTVTSTTTGSATVTAAGGTMYRDSSGTDPIADGDTVPTGTEIWVKSSGPSAVVISATALATVPSGNAYLYDQNSGLGDAQRLILSKEATLTTTASATAFFQPPGSLTLTKTFTGAGASMRSQVLIQVKCDGTIQQPVMNIPPGAAGPKTIQYQNIPAGSICEVIETADGSNSSVIVTTTGNPGQVTIPSGQDVPVNIVNDYQLTGSLVVSKSIQGPAAGHQGKITIRVTCGGVALTPDFVIPAGTSPSPIPSQEYDNIPAGSVCLVTEPGNGSTTEVAPPTTVGASRIIVGAGQIAQALLTDTYNFNPGELVVNKDITGTAAGQQGQITITVSCLDSGGQPVDPTLTPPFVINAGATGPQSKTYTGLPGNSTCTVLETDDGVPSGSNLADQRTDSSNEVLVPGGGTGTATLTDTYETGVLVINKTIVGNAAGQQGQVTIDVTCGGTALAPFVIDKGVTGTVSTSYPVLAGTSCTVSEPASQDGSVPGTIDATTTVVPPTITIAANGSGEVDVTNTYTFVPGSLTVTKVLAGPSAGKQGAITIQTSCVANGITTVLPELDIPAGTAPGSPALTATNPVAGTSVCTVAESTDGSSSTVSVVTVGSPQHVTVPPGPTGVTATVTDTYSPADGSLLLRKIISGPSAGKQAAVTIDVTCGATTFAPFVISAGAKAGTYVHPIDGISAGSTCTVTETNDGSTSTVVVTVTGAKQSVLVPAGTVVPVEINDIYSDGPGSLIVTKTLTGPAAGQQGPVSILVDCGGSEVFALDIPAGTAAGPVPQAFDTIPAGSTCSVQETVNGGTDAIAVDPVGSTQTVTIPAGGTASVALTDSFSPIASTTGELAFTGSAARQLGALAAALILVGTLAVVGARTRTRRWRRNRKDR
jgi:hypothetical protein